MANFGGFETELELSRTGLTIVSTAKKGDTTEEATFVVKAFEPVVHFASERKRAEEGAARFVEAARTQEKVAASGARHWAPIYKCGSTRGGAFYVTDYYPRASVRQLVEARVRLNERSLHEVVAGTVEGLIELDKACNRPHGNLKAPNIFVISGKAGQPASAVLTDPQADSGLDADTGRVADLRAIGELIYQLALRRAVRERAGWGVSGPEEWSHLGKNAGAWRSLCERLMSPSLSAEEIPLESLAEEVANLRPRKPLALAGLKWVALGVVAAAVAVVVYLMLVGRPWARLCDEYGDWAAKLCQDAAEQPRRANWTKDPDLKSKVLDNVDTLVDDKLDPKEIAELPDMDYKQLRSAWSLDSDARKRVLSREGRAKTGKALQAIAGIRQALSAKPSEERWSRLTGVQEQDAGLFEKATDSQQWEQLARTIDQIVDRDPRADWAEKMLARCASLDADISKVEGAERAKSLRGAVRTCKQDVDQVQTEYKWPDDKAAIKARLDEVQQALTKLGKDVKTELDPRPAWKRRVAGLQKKINEQIGRLPQGSPDKTSLGNQVVATSEEVAKVEALTWPDDETSIESSTAAVEKTLRTLDQKVAQALHPDPRSVWVGETLSKCDTLGQKIDSVIDASKANGFKGRLMGIRRNVDDVKKKYTWPDDETEIQSWIARVDGDLDGLTKSVAQALDPRYAWKGEVDATCSGIDKAIDQLGGVDARKAAASETELTSLRTQIDHVMGYAWPEDERRIQSQMPRIKSELATLEKRVKLDLNPLPSWKERMIARGEDVAAEIAKVAARDPEKAKAFREQLKTTSSRVGEIAALKWPEEERAVEEGMKETGDALASLGTAVSDYLGTPIDPRIAWKSRMDGERDILRGRVDGVEEHNADQARGFRKTLDRLARQVDAACDRQRLPWPEKRKEITEKIARTDDAYEMLLAKVDETLGFHVGHPDPRSGWKKAVNDLHGRIAGQTETLQQYDLQGARAAGVLEMRLATVDTDIKEVSRRPWRLEGKGEIESAMREINGQLQAIEKGLLEARLARAEQAIVALTGAAANAGEVFKPELADAEKKIADLCDPGSLRWTGENASEIGRRIEDLDAALKKMNVEIIRRYVTAERAIKVSSSGTLNLQWEDKLGTLGRNAGAEGLGDALACVEKVNGLKETLGRLDREIPAAQIDASKVRADRPWNASFAQTLKETREATLAAAVSALDWSNATWSYTVNRTFEDAWRRLRQDYGEDAADLETGLADFNAIQDRLESAYAYTETPPDGPTVEEIHREVSGLPAVKQESVKNAVKGLEARVKKLADIDGESDERNLIDWAKARPGSSLEVPIAAWRRLQTVKPEWPNTIEDLGKERDIREGLPSVLAQVKDSGRKAALEKLVAEQGQGAWTRCFAGLDDDAEIKKALAWMGDFGVDDKDLDGPARWKLALHAFREKVVKWPETTDDNTVDKAIDAFHKEIEAVPLSETERAKVQKWLTRLDDVKGKKGELGNPAKGGPAASRFVRTPWLASVEQDGKVVTFSGRPNGVEHALTFVRIDAGDGVTRHMYLCTTEVSVGLFNDVIADADKWGTVKELQSNVCPGSFWDGPLVWERSAGRGGIKPNKRWIVPISGVKSYPEGLSPERPTSDDPMQYVSPQAAMCFAGILGCRLPTAGEWEKAFVSYEKAGTTLWNRRDQTWSLQQEYIHELMYKLRRPGIQYPDGGIFKLPGQAPKEGEKAVAAVAYNDRVLWFAPVGRPAAASDRDRWGKTFIHLAGNVSELVCEEPVVSERQFTPTGAFLNSFVDGAKGRVSVIGASALSPPEEIPETPYSVDVRDARFGYSDVGCRIAFSAPSMPLVERLKRTLHGDGSGYLVLRHGGE